MNDTRTQSGASQFRQVLLVGDLEELIIGDGLVEKLPCQTAANPGEALEIAASQQFAVIAVAMTSPMANLASVLWSLRRANEKAKLILLAKMYQEPLAISLVQQSEQDLADDYLICPITVSDFEKWLEPEQPIASDNARAENVRIAARIRELERLATEDDLTGLRNRRYILEFARQIIEYASQRNGCVTLLIFDIDDFKHYNDMYGHLAGDEILKQAATLMRRCCRDHDVVGRIGGDEFAVVFWDEPKNKQTELQAERRSAQAQHPKEALFITERFRDQMQKTEFNMLGPGGEGVLTISGGLATFPHDGESVEMLFGKADQALLEAKRSGKNRIYLVGAPNAEPTTQ